MTRSFAPPSRERCRAARLPRPRVEGLAGLSVEEVAVRGVLRAGDRSVGFLQARDKKHYVVRPGDRLRDGLVEAMITDGW